MTDPAFITWLHDLVMTNKWVLFIALMSTPLIGAVMALALRQKSPPPTVICYRCGLHTPERSAIYIHDDMRNRHICPTCDYQMRHPIKLNER